MKENSFVLQSTSTSLIKEIGNHKPLWKKEIFELPLTNKIIENPTTINNKIIEDIFNINKSINLPTDNKDGDTGKQAARGIVIRRRKMRVHKLRKLRKRMKFVWGKAKQRREWKKEKRFLDGLLAQVVEANKFSAENYVNEKILKATEEPIPTRWKNKRLPQWLVKELKDQERQRLIAKKYKFWEECGKA